MAGVENSNRLINPPQKLFKPFTRMDRDSIMEVAKHLMNDPLNVSDELRDYDRIYKLIYYYLSGPNLIYEHGDFSGIIGFINILPDWKADMIFKIWDKTVWKKSNVRQAKSFIEMIMEIFHLKRINTDSPDPRIVKMARMVGFKFEGTRRNDFKWNGKYYDRYLLGKEN